MYNENFNRFQLKVGTLLNCSGLGFLQHTVSFKCGLVLHFLCSFCIFGLLSKRTQSSIHFNHHTLLYVRIGLLTLNLTLNSVVKGCYLRMSNTVKLVSILSLSNMRNVITTLISQRLDFCTSVLVNPCFFLVCRWCRILQWFSRLVPVKETYTPVKSSFHLLPVKQKWVRLMELVN